MSAKWCGQLTICRAENAQCLHESCLPHLCSVHLYAGSVLAVPSWHWCTQWQLQFGHFLPAKHHSIFAPRKVTALHLWSFAWKSHLTTFHLCLIAIVVVGGWQLADINLPPSAWRIELCRFLTNVSISTTCRWCSEKCFQHRVHCNYISIYNL